MAKGNAEALARLSPVTDSDLPQALALGLGDQPWCDAPIDEALRRLIAASGLPRAFSQATVELRPLPGDPGFAVRAALYRCAQEVISHLIRHSGANRMWFRLTSSPAAVELRIRDNGRGFVPRDPAGTGLGLDAIRGHAEAVGGKLEIAFGPGGTTISVKIPVRSDSPVLRRSDGDVTATNGGFG